MAKLISHCRHLDLDIKEETNKWGNSNDDGTFTVIRSLCEECFILELLTASIDQPNMPVEFAPGVPGESTTLSELIDSAIERQV